MRGGLIHREGAKRGGVDRGGKGERGRKGEGWKGGGRRGMVLHAVSRTARRNRKRGKNRRQAEMMRTKHRDGKNNDPKGTTDTEDEKIDCSVHGWQFIFIVL